jgi:peptide/nickel transport system substrate-binding protein
VAAIQTDEIDIVQRLSAEEAQRLLGEPGVRVIKYPVARIFYIAFNNLTTGVGQPTEDARSARP